MYYVITEERKKNNFATDLVEVPEVSVLIVFHGRNLS